MLCFDLDLDPETSFRRDKVAESFLLGRDRGCLVCDVLCVCMGVLRADRAGAGKYYGHGMKRADADQKWWVRQTSTHRNLKRGGFGDEIILFLFPCLL